MWFKPGLAQRIIIAFVVMTTLVAGAFAMGIVGTVYMIEERLISQTLGGDLDRLLRMDSMESWRHRPERDQLFYISRGPGDFAMPADLQNLSQGFHEVFRPPKAYHAVIREVAGRRYALLQDQSDFEEREHVLFGVVLVGFLISVAMACALGVVMARRVMAPLINLAAKVRLREQQLSEAPALAPQFPSDEVGQLAAAFDATLGQLRQALTRERLFTSDVSHELRTPLMVIATSCELLQANPALGEREQGHLSKIARSCEEMRDLAQTFLLLARAEHQQVTHAAQQSVREVADDLAAQWRGEIERKGLRFDYDPAETPPGLYHGPFLRTVLGNLLRNALHYTQSGHVALTFSAEGFVVEDSGIGIPEEFQDAVFQAFQRGAQAGGEGKGVGLSLVQRICHLQGWQVLLTEAQPHGCRFYVRLLPA